MNYYAKKVDILEVRQVKRFLIQLREYIKTNQP